MRSFFLALFPNEVEAYVLPIKKWFRLYLWKNKTRFRCHWIFLFFQAIATLLGKRAKNNLIVHTVQSTIPMHVLEVKNPTSVEPSYRHIDRIRDVLEAYPMIQYLGAFHSHLFPKSDYKGKSSGFLSEDDIKAALAEARELNEDSLELVIGLTRLVKTIRIARKSALPLWKVTAANTNTHFQPIAPI